MSENSRVFLNGILFREDSNSRKLQTSGVEDRSRFKGKGGVEIENKELILHLEGGSTLLGWGIMRK